MLNQGLVLTGSGFDINSFLRSRYLSTTQNSATKATISDSYQTINMEVNASGWKPDKFILKEGISATVSALALTPSWALLPPR